MGVAEAGFFELATTEALPLAKCPRLPWLTNKGHLEPSVRAAIPAETQERLTAIYVNLGGDPVRLAAKAPGRDPRPDFRDTELGCLVEVDEIQHFTTDRLLTLEFYHPDAKLWFSIAEYRTLIATWSQRANAYRAAKAAVDFPHENGRRAQRAYFDALRDLLAPTFDERPVFRVPIPECDPALALKRYKESRAELLRCL